MVPSLGRKPALEPPPQGHPGDRCVWVQREGSQAAGAGQAGREAPARDTRRARPAQVPTIRVPPRGGQPGCGAPARHRGGH